MRRNNRIERGEGRKKYSIIGDGETEVWYFQLMKQNEKLPIDIDPKLPQKKKLKDQYDLVKENLNKGYDKVFWILDFDTLIKEDREKKKGAKSVIVEFNEYKEEFNDSEKVFILVNNPCVEFWYLLHFEKTSKLFSKCEDAEKALKKHLPDYNKTEKYYKKANNDFYKKMKSNQSQAIQNATALGEFDLENPTASKSELYKF